MLGGMRFERLNMPGMFAHVSALRAIFVILILLLALPAMAQISDATLKNRVETEYPIVKYATDDWVRIQALREFSYKHTAYPTGVAYNAYQAGALYEQGVMNATYTLGDGYAFFDNYGGGVVCGGTADMLQQLYKLYGYPASYLRIGFYPPTPQNSNFGHVQTFAQITRDGKTFVTVNDPTPNLSYAWADGRSPIDYRDMIWLLAQNKSKYISYSDTSAPLDAKFSTTNGADFNVWPYSPNNQPATGLFFNPDANGNVSGRIDFPNAISTIDLDVPYFNGGTVTMTAYDTIGKQVGQVTGTDHAGQNHFSISASAVKYVLLTGNNLQNGYAPAIYITNLQVKIINPVITFSNAQGFTSTDPTATNQAAAKMDATFLDTAGFSVYPAPPNSTQLYFRPDPNNNNYIWGWIYFPKKVSSVDLDVTYFAGGALIMYAYDASGNLLGQVQGTDQPGSNHLSFTANVQAGTLIDHVGLFGRQPLGQGYAAINITNLQTKIISPVINFSHSQGFINNTIIDQTQNDHQHYINGILDGSRNNPITNTVGFYSDQSRSLGYPSLALGSDSIDIFNANYTLVDLYPDKWVYRSPRTIARFEALGDQAGSWKDQLKREGRPGETIYLHTFPLRSGATMPDFASVVDKARLILNDFNTITFSYAQGFTSDPNTGANNVNSPSQIAMTNATFSVENSAYFGLYPPPSSSTPNTPSSLYFAPDASGVKGRIDFTTPVSAIDLDVGYFPGGTVIMYAYDTTGNYKQVQGTDQPGQNHLGITANSGTKFSYVRLQSNLNGPALNISNVQLRTLGPTIRFNMDEGFTSNSVINSVAANMNAQFSVTNGGSYGLYQPSSSAPNVQQLLFNPGSSGNVNGKISFPTAVSAVDLDVVYFNGGTVTMTAYDTSGNQIGQVQGSDQPGSTLDHLNHLSIAGNPGSLAPISYVLLTGNKAGAAINIKNVQLFNWQ